MSRESQARDQARAPLCLRLKGRPSPGYSRGFRRVTWPILRPGRASALP
jgi:hypothetical protein